MIYRQDSAADAPVVAGTYDGKPVKVPTLLSWLAPEFDAYLVLPNERGEGRGN